MSHEYLIYKDLDRFEDFSFFYLHNNFLPPLGRQDDPISYHNQSIITNLLS